MQKIVKETNNPLRATPILPLVYDDTLSFYELLGKLIYKVNEVISFINEKLRQLIYNMVKKMYASSRLKFTYTEATRTLELHEGLTFTEFDPDEFEEE